MHVGLGNMIHDVWEILSHPTRWVARAVNLLIPWKEYRLQDPSLLDRTTKSAESQQ